MVALRWLGSSSPRSRTVRVVGALLPFGIVAGAMPAATAVVDQADRPHADAWWSTIMKLDRVHGQATGKGVTVAVLDGGLQPGVPALEGADVRMMKSPCLNNRRATRAPGSRQAHGSRMTSLIAGTGNGPTGRGSGVLGVAPGARVLFYDVDEERNPVPSGGGLSCGPEAQVRTVLAAMDAGADVVSMSFGMHTELIATRLMRQAVARNDAVIVMASPRKGENGPGKADVLDMSAMPGVVSVNALDRSYKPYSKSITFWDKDKRKESLTPQWFSPVVSAPGVDIAIPGAAGSSTVDERSTGTSSATALVAGSIAVVKEKYPDATANQLIQGLVHHTTRDNQTGADKAPDMLWALHTGYGPVSPLNMLKHDPAGWPDENPLLGTPVTMAERYPSSMEGSSPSPAASSPSATANQPAASEGATDDTSATPSSTHSAGTPLWAWVLVALVILGALAGALLLALRRRRSTRRSHEPVRATDDVNDNDYQRAGGQ